jgi:hypothetical protein
MLVLACVAICRIAFAQEAPFNVRLLGQIGGASYALDVQHPYLYFGEGPNLVIMDISSPTSPVVVSRALLPGPLVKGIRVKDGLAYVAEERSGLQIVDVPDPKHPWVRGAYTSLYVGSVFIAGTLVYSAGAGIHIIDVSNPSSPTLVSTYPMTMVRDVWVSDNIAYAARDRDMALSVVDVSDPSSPTGLSHYYMSDVAAFQLAVSNHQAYIGANWLTYSANFMPVINVSDPTSPSLQARIPGKGLSIFIEGDRAYVGYNGYFRIYDVSDASSPTFVGGLGSLSGQVERIHVAQGRAYLTNGRFGLYIADVNDPTSPRLLAHHEALGEARRLHVANGLAYVANGFNGLRIVDVRSPRNPVLLGGYPIGHAIGLDYADSRLYMPSGGGRFYVLDVSNPSSPTRLSSYRFPDWMGNSAISVDVNKDIAYVGNDEWLSLLDVSDPSSATSLSRIPAYDLALDVSVSSGIACLADRTGLAIFDVRNPRQPVLSSYLHQYANNVCTSGNQAWVSATFRRYPWSGSADSYVGVVDFTTPTAPVDGWIYFRPMTYGGDVFVSDGRVYADVDGLKIFDGRNPASPVLIGSYPTPNPNPEWPERGTGIYVVGDTIYFAANYSGLWILKYTGSSWARTKRWGRYE